MKHAGAWGAAAVIWVGAAPLAGCGDGQDTTPEGGQGLDGNDARETAQPIDMNKSFNGELAPTGDIDFYRFEGKAGQILQIDIDAESLDLVQYDRNHIDTWLSLHDADGNQIAFNDDEIPESGTDSMIMTRLPGDGTFFVRVAECWSSALNPAEACASPKEKIRTSYRFGVFEYDPAFEFVTTDKEAGDDAASAEMLKYVMNDSGGFLGVDILGTFKDATDVDVFSFKMPATVEIPPGRRSTGTFWVFPGTHDGSGSTTDVGRAYITDAADPATVLAEVTPSEDGRSEVSPPLSLDKEYLLFLTHPETPAGSNDFYVVRHRSRPGNLVEQEEMQNNALATAEELLLEQADIATYDAFIEGDLPAAAQDVDHFKVTVPKDTPGAGQVKTVTIVCSAMQRGSGLRHLTISLFDGSGQVIPVDPMFAQETVEQAASVDAAIPQGATALVFKVQADHDPNIMSAFYRCGLYLHP